MLDPWDVFMDGSQFVIGEVIAANESEIHIEVADSFIPYGATNEGAIAPSEVISFSSEYWDRYEHFQPGDYVVASLDPENTCSWDESNIFHTTSLNYAILQVENTSGHALRILTDFVNHRATYEYREGGAPRGTRIYRQHRQHQTGFTVIYDETKLILGQIVALNPDDITIEIWDYVATVEHELSFDRLNLWGYGSAFDDFNVGDDVAVNIRMPVVDEDTRTLVAMPTFSLDIFSVHNLADGSIQLTHIREEDSDGISTLYTDLLQHRGEYSYVVTFGRFGRYQSVARVVDDELIMIYEQDEVIEDLENPFDELEDEILAGESVESDWLIVTLVIAGTGVMLGVAVVIIAIKTRKQVLSDKKS